ncbi:MAG TPA: CDGSH iron-sulfur domain-containing protein [Dermatophilaceae bacterium]|nr:CDGSH iron-sulfur domain-containing protein [Dermatophilaceae bacterium]
MPTATRCRAGGAPLAVCRCGGSSIAPWCDGTHRLLNRARRASAATTES